MTNLSKAREEPNKMLTSSRQLHSPHSTMIQYKFAKFLITDQPTRQNMDLFIKECQSYHVRDLVRVCEPEYDTDELEKAGIEVLDWLFDDGSAPPESIINMWHDLVKSRFLISTSDDICVAVHCKAGLGRAPALVAISLIEMGLPYDQAIELIRDSLWDLKYRDTSHHGQILFNLDAKCYLVIPAEGFKIAPTAAKLPIWKTLKGKIS